MDKTADFRLIKHTDIDTDKWMRCIDNALNCRVYAYDWHLDRTAIIWDALVWGDYEYVMPLPVRRKFGITYIYLPPNSQQLGIFPSPPSKVSQAFYKYLVAKFKFCETTLNSENVPTNNCENVQFTKRDNFLLPLNQPLETIKAAFSKNTKRNISKAKKQKLTLLKGISLQEFLTFKAETAPAYANTESLNELKSIIAFGISKGFGKIYGVYTANNQLCAAVYFCHCKNRIIYYNAASNKEGKEQRAMYFLLDKFIEQNAGKNILLDFEGSMIPGIARFYGGLGAKPESYFLLKFNRLPVPFKWFKR